MHSIALSNLLQNHGTTEGDSATLVCEKRKVVYVLSYGVLDSVYCFRDEKPSPSYAKKGLGDSTAATSPSTSRMMKTIVPNGWKVAVYVNKQLWTTDILYHGETPTYRMSLVDEFGNASRSSPYAVSPFAAYDYFFKQQHPNTKMTGINARLFFGCHYDVPQQRIIDFFRTKVSIPAFVSQNECVQREFVFLRAAYMVLHPTASDSPSKRMKVDTEEDDICDLISPKMNSWAGWSVD